MKRVIYKIFDFTSADNKFNRTVDRKSVEELIADPGFQKRLRSRTLYGSITHKCRNLEREYSDVVSTQDIILANELEANILENVFIKGNGCFAQMLVLDSKEGMRASSLIDAKSDLRVSVSMRTYPIADKWIVKDIIGVDFTATPAFPTTLVSTAEVSK